MPYSNYKKLLFSKSNEEWIEPKYQDVLKNHF